MEKRIGKRDLIFLLIVVLVIGGFFLAFLLQHKENGALVEVELQGESYATYSLAEDGTYVITQENGDTNTLCIQDGYAYVVNCSCPDKLCEHQKRISKDGESIVCLPNQFVATVHSQTTSEYDGVTD